MLRLKVKPSSLGSVHKEGQSGDDRPSDYSAVGTRCRARRRSAAWAEFASRSCRSRQAGSWALLNE